MLTSNRNRTPLTGLATLAVGAALLAITIPVAGFGAPQTGPASFSGKLVDTVGRMMPDEAIVMTHQTTKAGHETRSDASGNFSFARLEPGDYTIEVSSPGFSPRYRVSLAAGQALQRDITLQLGTLQETITVTKSPGASVGFRAKQDPATWVRQPRACEQSLKGGCIEQPMKLVDKRPIYPESRVEGQVVKLECRIDTDGVPGRVRVLGPADPEFAKAAAEAVEQWRFSPTYLDGIAVQVDMNVTVNFKPE